MVANNILHQHLSKQYSNTTTSFPRDRCNGLSTAIAFAALAEAMKRPEHPVYIEDHAGKRADQFTVWLAESVVSKLQMVGFAFKRNNLGYYVVYDLYPIKRLG